MSQDCRDSPWGWAGEGGHCDLGVCAPRGNSSGEGGSGLAEAGAAWACACDAGWARFPAVGAAPRCTVSHAAVLAFAAFQAASAAVLIACSAGQLCGVNRFEAGLVTAAALCSLAGALLQLASPARLAVDSGSGAVFVLKMTSCMLTSNVCTRLTILKYRRAAMDKLARESSRPFARHAEGGNERAAALRTRVEIAASLVCYTIYLVVATSSSISTRHAALGMFLCWLLAPASVWASTIQTTRSLLIELDRIELFLSYDASSTSRMTPIENTTSRRISLAKDKANKLRNFVGIGFGSVMFASAVALVLLPISDQWCWIVFEVQASVNIGFFALTVLTLRRISHSRRTAKAQVHTLSTVCRPSQTPARAPSARVSRP
jgi:hypothetical protein